jgi:hypothetical protein
MHRKWHSALHWFDLEGVLRTALALDLDRHGALGLRLPDRWPKEPAI